MPLAHELPLDEVNLISSWVESMLFGMHCVLFGFCIHTLWRRRKLQASRNLIMVTTAMIALAFTHVALSLRGLLEGFIWHFAGKDAPVALYYANFAAPLYCTKDTIYVANSFLADGLMLWRVWVVWSYDWKAVAVPALLYAGSMVTGIRAMVVLWEIQQNSTIFVITLVEWISAFWALSLAVNILCTSMICFRIARKSVSTRAYRDVIAVIVESGALYTISVALHMTMYDIKSNTGQITGDIATQLSVICPTLIIVLPRDPKAESPASCSL
ncbi:hypothetical protein AURDEDRAFT_187080 [Auricularia subglabra TFB-10046 SS5]|nr:hypothetical protein AURDEDRAFT_187080 [Auricularia subglabra TFB-10046 SS5]